jgi:regulator of protease activity HflC (stomatin/prohibitin superfamily)
VDQRTELLHRADPSAEIQKMFGIQYMKVAPTTYVMHFKRGKLKRAGAGLAFFYFAPNSEIAAVPVSSVDVPFVFTETTADFQEATIQGELTYRVVDAQRLAAVLNFSVDRYGRHLSDDPLKLNERLSHVAQNHARSFTQQHKLREVLTRSDELTRTMLGGLKQSPAVEMLGVEVLGLSILSIKPTPEMAKALQAEAREDLLRHADEAVYARRNNAVQLERTIKENELNTEIAVQQKNRQVRETQMAAEIAVEEQRASLVEQRTENERKEADARAHSLQVTLEPLKTVDWRTLMAASSGVDPKMFIAMAFRDLAENASKIGQLNVTPDLLNELIASKN